MAIDVLAMMDAAVARLPDSEAAPLDEARAAVAELIEADKEYDAAYECEWRSPAPPAVVARRKAAAARRAAALARVQGGQP